MNARHLALRLLLLGCVALALIWVALNRDRLDPAVLDTWLAGLGVWAPLAYVGLYAVGTVVFVPGALFALAGGVLFGPVWGAILNLLGATIGAGLAFLIARYVAGEWVVHKVAGRLRRLIDGAETEGWRFVAFVRLVPLFPFNLTNYALGLTRIGFWPYIVASLICMAPGAVAYTWLGYAGREAIGGDSSAIRYGLLALGLLAGIAFLPRLVNRMRKTETAAWIEPDELHRQIESGGPLTVLDVRGTDEFVGQLGHIPGAANIPLGELDHRLDEVRSKVNGDVAVVCRTDRRSAAAQTILSNAGLKNVVVLRGGMELWRARGYETVRDLAGKRSVTT